ncbi:UNVERIFIED_CONTAM: hypothetical protein NCL1_27845 [Trichonephila clavipes]
MVDDYLEYLSYGVAYEVTPYHKYPPGLNPIRNAWNSSRRAIAHCHPLSGPFCRKNLHFYKNGDCCQNRWSNPLLIPIFQRSVVSWFDQRCSHFHIVLHGTPVLQQRHFRPCILCDSESFLCSLHILQVCRCGSESP